MIILVANQKGGCGKSTIARALSRELAAAKLTVVLADMDQATGTSRRWAQQRAAEDLRPKIAAQIAHTPRAIQALAERYDHVVVDGQPYAPDLIGRVAAIADLVVIPTGAATDDLEPTVWLVRHLKLQGRKDRVRIVLNRVGSDSEAWEARQDLEGLDVPITLHPIQDRVSHRGYMSRGYALTENRMGRCGARATEAIGELMACIAELARDMGEAAKPPRGSSGGAPSLRPVKAAAA